MKTLIKGLPQKTTAADNAKYFKTIPEKSLYFP